MNTELKLEVGKKYTVVNIDSMLAMTHRVELTITDKACNKNGEPLFVYKQKGKRTEYYLQPKNGFIFEGWNVPFRVDTDGGSIMRGNACFNFVGDANVIRDWIDNRNLNPDSDKRIALVVDNTKHSNDGEEFLYSELAEKSTHAVIRKLIERNKKLAIV